MMDVKERTRIQTAHITISATNMVSSIFSSFTLFLFLSSWMCSARDNTTLPTTPLRDEMGDTLVSSGERFELGFFTPCGRNEGKKYLGIWYYRYNPQTVVWVANRENPLDNSRGVFSLGQDGNLQVMDVNGTSYWSARIESTSSSFSLKLMDSGNLVLIQEAANGSAILWQSFDYPTDTFLPGMKIDKNFMLTSWKSSIDPAPGDFKFQLDERENQYIIMKNGSIPYWKSGVSGSFVRSDERLWLVSNLLMNSSRKPSSPLGNTTTTKESPYDRINSTAVNYKNTRLVVNFDGQIQVFLWRNANWTLIWREPSDRCSVFDACGTFGICNSQNRIPCKCLPGFQPRSPDNWKLENFAEGCERMSPLCSNDVAPKFLELKSMKAGKPDAEPDYSDENDCMNKCLSKCNCQAYSYHKAENGDNNFTCWTWFKDLNNIQEQYDRGRDFNVRVPLSAIASVTRKCEMCGTTVIPYPLSTGPNCGDQMYFRFHCDDSSSQLMFEVPGGAYYRVTGIDEEFQKFSIHVEDASCKAIELMGNYTQSIQSWPFHVIGRCDANRSNSRIGSSFEDTGFAEVEIGWTDPSEPLCYSLDECNDWRHSTCSFARDGKKRCLCNKSFRWDPKTVNCISASVKRKCEMCGTTVIPYPLSTGPNCGDQMYFRFHCDDSSSQLMFEVPGGAYYRVTGIDEEFQKFSIHVEDANCKAIESMGNYKQQRNQSSPFYVIGRCDANRSNIILGSSFEDTGFVEVEIGWIQPSEPLCNSLDECNDLPHSTCSPARDGMKRCLCNKSFWWDPKTVNCISASTKKRRSLYLVLLGVVAASVIILCASFFLYHMRRSTKVTGRENRESIQGNVAFHLNDTERRSRDLISADHFTVDDKKGIDVPIFDMECILAATDNFSGANKLGQGGFGPVYKGKLPGGQEIAIKRLSYGSGQGLEEFKNEITLIVKLQHRNLVRLLGYCEEGREKMLAYEYMPNKSLDVFIFDRTLCVLLNWELRFNIIMGIARGLLYLHRDSRLKIIHRDLKTSNVLLDEEMNPKISDFGLARILRGKQTEGNTQRVVGTYGYMAPEYAMDGDFSTKSDVFSFGVIVLEILSGKRNAAFYKSDQNFSLSAYAWKLWKEEKVLDLMDRALCDTCDANEFVRCVNVGLLCVQEHQWDRPTMSNVVFMLESDTASLPTPKKPAFAASRSLFNTASSSSKADSYVDLTNTLEQGR
ncbi:PREDICTED: G-type lectin S-receptor-like serine/threonine-protein kinase At4g03230 [Populus euphratica]|uniref:non-specific serine/threonine protein kinase n=1 Tax=Populus euphratica TaxID=75702 RepID=A0AAJ6TW29_POPEU|nr:PREDICTED: G-type lectin S-receptor-like serine/threonine-protein kinase At4g03230 [Populus euphratica]